MKSNQKLYNIIGIVALVIIDIVIWAVVKEYTVARIINIIGVNLAVIILWCSLIMSNNTEKHYLEYTRMPIVLSYSIIAFAVSLILILLKVDSVKFSAIIQLIMLGVFIITMCVYKMGNNKTEETMQQDTENYNKIKGLTEQVELILDEISDRELYKKVEKAYDDIKNANLSVKEDTFEIDEEIETEITQISKNVEKSDLNGIDTNVANIKKLIAKRNKM